MMESRWDQKVEEHGECMQSLGYSKMEQMRRCGVSLKKN
jgi:hypothetical protein